MQFISLITLIFTLIGCLQAFPIESRSPGTFYGVTYNARHSDGSCQSASEVSDSIKLMKSNGITHIRTYSQECDQLPSILKAIKAQGGGMTVLAAVWLDGSSGDDQEISTLKSVLSKNYGNQYIQGILVGNEVIFNNVMSDGTLINKIKQVKAFASDINVGTAEIPSSYTNQLVTACDMVASNVYPFFSNVNVDTAISNLKAQYNNLKKVAGSKNVWITETGWPSSGSALGNSVPSETNGQKYVTGLLKSSLPYYYFEWQDSDWKSEGTEKSFGLLNSAAQLGGQILSPKQNDTVQVGQNTEISFQYENVGTGDYTVDIQLWQDAAASVLIDNITIGHEIKSGNSSGSHVDFVYNDTYTWKVPHGLNETFYLTVIEHAKTPIYAQGITMRSRPVMLHTSSAVSLALNSFSLTFLVGVSFLIFSLSV
ncbi:hypothetical protein G6F66_004505 [Rhizopus arrhizus]|nr:hypothetical protein G6F66_004505 [Rhizopus arrhizus]